MPFSVAFLLITLVLILLVFWVVTRERGLLIAIAAASVTLVCMAAVFITLITLVTSRM